MILSQLLRIPIQMMSTSGLIKAVFSHQNSQILLLLIHMGKIHTRKK
jgi:hypothetical protein